MGLLNTGAGWTADAIAAARAIHCIDASPAVIEDDVAIDLLSPTARFLCRSKLLRRRVLAPAFAQMGPFILHSFACQRYTEEQLTSVASRGPTQYVILGAGLDSFALRRPDLKSSLRVYEVDHPKSQAVKRERIASSPHATPANLEFVPVDFERETVLDGLKRSEFDFGRPAFCSWLGTVMYLTDDAIFATLGAIASLKSGSELVFNYTATSESLSDAEREMTSSLERKLRLTRTPLQSGFAPDELASKLDELGFGIHAHLSARDLDGRYIDGREGSHTIPSGRLLHLQVKG